MTCRRDREGAILAANTCRRLWRGMIWIKQCGNSKQACGVRCCPACLATGVTDAAAHPWWRRTTLPCLASVAAAEVSRPARESCAALSPAPSTLHCYSIAARARVARLVFRPAVSLVGFACHALHTQPHPRKLRTGTVLRASIDYQHTLCDGVTTQRRGVQVPVSVNGSGASMAIAVQAIPVGR